MQLKFVKYQATGNDFIVINNLQNRYKYDPIITKRLCHRQFGVGADGIITIEKKSGYDFEMRHYNSDGSTGGGLCGNGARSVLHYAQQLGLMKKAQAFFWAIDGLHTGYISNGDIYLRLEDVNVIQKLALGYFLNNGTRHYIEIVGDIEAIDMDVVGFPRRRMAPFENEGINLNFVQLAGETILVRTCECGLDSEPLSCGTGAVASALVVSNYYGWNSPVAVVTKGGKLWVKFSRLSDGCFTDIYLVGAAYQSFSGVVSTSLLAPCGDQNI